MDIEWMRNRLYELYPGVSWKARVRNMPTNQVVAVYKSCEKYDRFNKRKKINKQNQKEDGKYYQYTIFDYI